jgi:hypothetical protein
MPRVSGSVIIGLVARKAIAGNTGVITIHVTSGAIVDIMSLGKRKFAVIKNSRFPAWCGCMAYRTIGREIRDLMIWIGSGIIISLMTTYTL